MEHKKIKLSPERAVTTVHTEDFNLWVLMCHLLVAGFLITNELCTEKKNQYILYKKWITHYENLPKVDKLYVRCMESYGSKIVFYILQLLRL